MNTKGRKAKKQATNNNKINVLSKEELGSRIAAIEADLKSSTWKDLEVGAKFDKNAKLTFISDDMLIVKGVNVFPSQIETVLMNDGYPANYQIIVTREHHSDRIEVQVEMTPEMFSDSLKDITKREKQLVNDLKGMLGIACIVKLVAPRSIPRSEGKAKRVIDLRGEK